ncbi:MAG: hypothetical protein QW165_00840 [Candidatus Woesearchaeota archaeon]
MVEVHIVQPAQLPEAYKRCMERILSAPPARQAEETCSVLERLAYEHSGEEFFSFSKTILQYLGEPALECVRQKAKMKIDTCDAELPEDVRLLYRILEPCSKTGPRNLVERLTPMLIENFIDRKYKGRIDVVVDIDTGHYYLVPKDMEHSEFIPKIPRRRNESMIPFYLMLEKDNGKYHVTQLVIGASSFEAEHNVRHAHKELQKARELAWNLIINSPVLSNDRIQRDEVLKDYATGQPPNRGTTS